MSNLSLKEQLQALSLGSSAVVKEPPARSAQRHHHNKKRPAKETNAKTKPAWLEQALYGVELLKTHYPACFRDIKEVKPLKIGIKQDLIKNLGAREDIVVGDKACMVSSLSYYVNSISYHKSMIEGTERIDLEGNPSGVVTAEEAKYSNECRQSKMQKKKKNQQANEKVKLEQVENK